jgi:LPXTG-motif cell wall-anchored protein
MLALATPAWAATAVPLKQSHVPIAAPGADPRGANGTVKIDGAAFDDGIDNEPHVSCDFQVDFFNFDAGERANIVFAVQPPTGPGTQLLRRDNVLVSQDAAGGGAPDPDETFAFSAGELGLDAYAEAQHGYHVKLTVERIGAPGAGKHKVFWIEPCQAAPIEASLAPGTVAGTPATVADTAAAGGAVGGAGGVGGSSLPITGASIGIIVVLGGALLAAGATLLVVRRRGHVTWIS